MRNVYLIASDIHDNYCNSENRVDYVKEIDLVREKIISLGKEYKQKADNVYLMLLGDVFKGSYNEPDSAVIINNFWYISAQLFTKIYSVLGNHETSFYSCNPFFTLVSEIESEKVKKILNKNWQPKGLRNVFNVVDLVEDGNVVFHFNHYDTPISRALPGRTNIALYHQDIVNKQILDLMQVNFKNQIYQKQVVDFDSVDIFDGFSYNFFGHLHKVYGTFECMTKKQERTVLCYLASLGRPNVTEVNNNFLERDIPALIVHDGELEAVESNKFFLPRREDCVIEQVVEIQKKNYEEIKQRKAVKNYIPCDDDPILNIKNCDVLTEKDRLIFTDLLDSDTDRFTKYLLERIANDG